MKLDILEILYPRTLKTNHARTGFSLIIFISVFWKKLSDTNRYSTSMVFVATHRVEVKIYFVAIAIGFWGVSPPPPPPAFPRAVCPASGLFRPSPPGSLSRGSWLKIWRAFIPSRLFPGPKHPSSNCLRLKGSGAKKYRDTWAKRPIIKAWLYY